ncbi:hypothetical protein Dimus_038178 [Dionaea muscipula]
MPSTPPSSRVGPSAPLPHHAPPSYWGSRSNFAQLDRQQDPRWECPSPHPPLVLGPQLPSLTMPLPPATYLKHPQQWKKLNLFHYSYSKFHPHLKNHYIPLSLVTHSIFFKLQKLYLKLYFYNVLY